MRAYTAGGRSEDSEGVSLLLTGNPWGRTGAGISISLLKSGKIERQTPLSIFKLNRINIGFRKY
jgi:hypothetical protein